jgi:rhamnosyltransferase
MAPSQMKDSAADRLPIGRDICAIVVTYHPDAELPGRLSRILHQLRMLIIVDNGSGEAAVKMLQDLATNPLVSLVLNAANLGIARALNIGIERAAELGFPWVLLLDQDSHVDTDMVRTLIEVYTAYPDRDRLAVIGSGFRDGNDALQGPTDPGGDGCEEREMVITSGSLIPLRTHAVVGPFREEFFIDYVDSEYCFRARSKGYCVIKTRKPIMSHPIGAITRHKWLWFHKWTFNHSADRRYYIARNDTVMLREYGNYQFGLWALKSFGRCFRLCRRIVFYEKMKASKIIAVAQGWCDGVRGRMGPRRKLKS